MSDTIVEVLIPGLPGPGLPAGGTGDVGKFPRLRRASGNPYDYELVTPDAIGLPQALATTDSPTFAGLTLSGLAANGLLFTGTGGLLTRLPLGPGLSIVGGQLTATGTGTVTSVGLSVPTGFSVNNSPVTGSGTLALGFAAGYSLPTDTRQAQWDGAVTLAGTAVQPGALTAGLAGKADLDGTGRVPSAQLPGFVDDVLEFANIAAFPATGETGKLYISLATNRQYRWSGSVYVEINPSPGSTDGVPEGSVNLYFTSTRGQAAAASWWSSHSSTVGKQLATAADATAGRTAIGAEQAGAAAGVQTALTARLDQFRDARTFYVSKRAGASDSNNGTSPGEPFLTIGAAVAAANAFRVANPSEFAAIEIGPGTYVEPALPLRLRPNILLRGIKQRCIRVKPAAGQELSSFVAVDSGCMVCDITFAGHQAQNTSPTDSSVGTRAWAIAFNEQANGGQGVILTASPYIKDCLSLTAEDDTGEAGSTSTGDCGGGVEVDGAKCHPSSPIRSMVIYGFTQQNLGGPGAVVKNDAYAELVSFFGLFGTWHVRCETGGQATMSGGGCSEFGIYGLVADGYSPTSLFTGSLRVVATAGDTSVDVVSLSSNRLGSSSRPAAGQVLLLGGQGYVVQSSLPITAGGVVVPDSDPARAGYRVSFFNPTGAGLVANAAQGAAASFRQRSQISAGCHSANYVGSGTNYSALPWNGGVPIRANEIVETNFGRVFGLIVNDIGDVRIANGAFEIDGTTGEVTINTSSFNLSGLNAIGPFSRNGGISTVGVQLQEVSNNTSLLASTGASDGNTAPTQSAVRSYVDNRFLVGLTRTSGQPLTITDTSTQDGSGFWTRTRNIELSMNTANGLVRLDGTGRLPAVDGSQLTGLPATGVTSVGLSVPTGFSVNNSPVTGSGTLALGFATGYSLPTDARQADWDAAFAQRRQWDGGSQHLNAATGRASLELGSAAQAATTDFATPAALASGLAGKADLVGGVVPSSQIPSIAISDYLGSVSSQSAMLALTGQRGDWCIRTDGGSAGAWILAGEPSSLLANWVQIPMPAVPVQSVNGQVGVVTLGPTDVGAAAASHTQAASTISDFTTAARGTVSAAGSLSYDPSTGIFSYTAPTPFDPASPGAIGGTAPAAGTFTAGAFTQSILLPSAAPGTPAAGHLYRVADTLRYRDSGAVERLLLNAADNLANLASAATARDNLGAAAAYRQCIDLAAVAGVYTIDVQATAQRIIKLGTIAGNVTINLANGSTAITSSVQANIPTGTQWEAVIRYTWTSGAITFLTANTGITRLLMSPDLTSPVSGKIYEILLSHERGTTVMGWRQVGGQP
jgi:hypothetical protein